MTDGFHVDVLVLRDAGQGVQSALSAVHEERVEDLDAPEDAFGHNQLAAAARKFCDRWQYGLDHLLRDGDELAQRLADAAGTYEQVDQAVFNALSPPTQQLDDLPPGGAQ